jgi:hypothetical protein
MLTLDIYNADLTDANRLRSEKTARLAQLQRELSLYYGLITSGSIAEALAYRQAVNVARDAQPDGTPAVNGRSPTDPASVAAAIGDLDIRRKPGVAQIFELLLDVGEGARTVTTFDGTQEDNTAIVNALVEHLRTSQTSPSNEQLDLKKRIKQCVQIHLSDDVNIPQAGSIDPSQTPSQIFYRNLNGALPVLDSNDTTEVRRIRKRCPAIRMKHPLLIPGEKNAQLLSVFFNSMPALELTRATPVLNITIYSSRQITENGKLAAITLQKFVEGSKASPQPTAQNVAERAIGLASQVSASLFGNTEQSFQNYSVVGMELFRSPQTLINPDGTKQRENYLAPIIDPMRPLASIKSFDVDIKSTVGLMSTKVGTVQLVLHDRSRLGEFADFVKPDRYGTSFIEVEYGWSHPDPLGVNPFADLLNLTRIKEHYNIITSNFSFDDVGQVNVTLNCMGRGTSETTELSILGETRGIRAQIARMEQLSKEINDLSNFTNVDALSSAEEGSHRREIRGQQALLAAGDSVNNLIINEELFKQFRELKGFLTTRRDNAGRQEERASAQRLLERIEALVGPISTTGSARNITPGGALRNLQSSVNNDINNLLNRINPGGANDGTSTNRYNDAFFKEIPQVAWEWLIDREGGDIDNQHVDAIRQENVNNQLTDTTAGTTPTRATGNNAANANTVRRVGFSGKKVVSLGTLIMAFVARPLAELKDPTGQNPRFAEVQTYFYNFNNKASIMSYCDISQFPVNATYFSREYARLRLENTTRAVNLTVAEFMNFLATRIVDDVMNPAYGMTDLYKANQTEQTQANPRTFERTLINRMKKYNISKHSDFVMPQVTFEMEAVPALINGRLDASKTVLKIHVYDRTCSANTSLRELMALSTNTLLSTLSSYPVNEQDQDAVVASVRDQVPSRGRTAAQRQAEQNQVVSDLQRSWGELHRKIVHTAMTRNPPLIREIDNTRNPVQYSYIGGAQAIKEYAMENVPHIIYGAMGTTVRNATLSSRTDPLLATINMQRSMNANPVMATGEQAGGIPLSIYPVELSISTLGCPFVRYSQEIFVDFNTNTTADNIYVVTGVTHKLEQGTFETTLKLTAIDAFGQYRNIIEQLNTAKEVVNHISTGGGTTSPTTPTTRR